MRPSKTRFRAGIEAIERRDLAGVLGLASSALALYNSPIAVAARAAAFGYHVGQLAWTGHTGLLLGTVQVTQPYPLKTIRHLPHRPHAPTHPTSIPQPHLAFRNPF
ncbi:MAG TPA: hypothetical protein VKP69_31130 [Isosphaeraceae bacterium]|nr:hypothetical protein [Isosphaeraceae bacterium]